MSNCRFISVILILSLLFTNLIPLSQALAESPIAFGEIKPAGDVMTESSTGQWVKMKEVYPLLKDTKLKTGEGIVSIITKDGSKIDLSRETEAIINVTDSNYTVTLVGCSKGTLSFNMTPPASLTVTTTQATLSTVRVPSQANIQGMVINSDKGTDIRSISGRITVRPLGLQPKVLNTGESLFASLSDECKAIIAKAPATGTAAGVPSIAGDNTRLLQGLIVGAFFVGGTIVALEAFREEGVASPSGFLKE